MEVPSMLATWKARLRKELWVAFVVFPATLFVGYLVQFLFDKQMQAQAREQQVQLATDLFEFNPILLLWKIVQATVSVMSGWLYQFEQSWIVALIRLPLVIASIPFALIQDTWQTGSVLSAIMVTVAFILGALIGFMLADEMLKGNGILVFVGGAGFALVIGSLICTFLWGFIWVALVLFGWFLVFAGYCAAAASMLSGIAVTYVRFRASRMSEATLDRAGPD